MGRKTTIEKGKGKQSDVQYDKCHRTRCSPSELAKTYAVLSNEKKALVHEMGFGLNATGGLYRQKLLKKEVPPEQYEAADKYRKKSLADLRDMVTQIQLDTEEGITNFKRAFILVSHTKLEAGPQQDHKR
ncbi:hypothetical protein PIB30_097373 [Stylosanthes scabra]|uniref:Uncharacterized protein n=1 Tax=Stylosanthes scabra TaxID=79078 RepID=A0ABU6XVY1_9FABA|nr:hypothetical protein [Stylosanthes scabra]